MSKIDRLGWAVDGYIEPYSLKFAMRANSLSAFQLMSDCTAPLGWSVLQEPTEAHFLYSYLRPPDRQRRGRRSFHLLYLNASLLFRTLDGDELLEFFKKDLVHAVECRALEHFVIRGRVKTGKDGVELILSSELADRAGSALDNEFRIILDKKGFVYNLGVRKQLQKISIIPEQKEPRSDLPLTPGVILGELLVHSVSSKAHAAPHLARLVQETVHSARRTESEICLMLDYEQSALIGSESSFCP